MLVIKGKKQIDLNGKGDIFIIKKGNQQITLQEDDNGDIEYPVDDIFGNAEKWQWGIKTDKYYGVFLRAINFKIPKLVLSVEKIIVSIKVDKEKESVVLMALVFDEDKDKAFKDANKIKRDNREFVAFELIPSYEEYPLNVSKLEVINLLSNITSTLEEIKEDTKQVKENTNVINLHTELILKEVEKIAKSVNEIKEKVEKIEPVIKTLEEKGAEKTAKESQDENKLIIHKINEDGVYDEEGDKLYVKMIGSIFDYLDIDISSIKRTFEIKEISKEQEEKLRNLIKEKYFNKEKYVTAKDLSKIGLSPKLDTSWRISLKIKDAEVKRAGSFLSKHLNIKDIESKLMSAIKNVVSQKKELTIDDLQQFLDEDEIKAIEKVKKIIKGKEKVVNGKVYVKADKEVEEILLNALLIQAEKENKEVVIK